MTEFPKRLERIPGRLSVLVFSHTIESRDGALDCWSFVTDGLRRHGQKEIAFTLRRGPEVEEAAFPRGPVELFEQVHGLAERGQLVDVGGLTRFGPGGFLGREDFGALGYMPAQPLEEVKVPLAALAAIMLTTEEADTAEAFGLARVMARLGQAHSHYPCPPWTDLSRPGLGPFDDAGSLLARLARAAVPGAWVRQEENTIRLRLPGAGTDWGTLVQQLPPEAPFAVLTDVDPEADACLVWEPRQSGPAAITPPEGGGTRIAGCFAAFVAEQAEDAGQIFEDGFAMMLTEATWASVREALQSGSDLRVPATGEGMGFVLEWRGEPAAPDD